jgi:hypothetical protein
MPTPGFTEEDEAQFLLDNLNAYARPVQDLLAPHDAPTYRAPLTPAEAETSTGDTFPMSPLAYSPFEEWQRGNIEAEAGARATPQAFTGPEIETLRQHETARRGRANQGQEDAARAREAARLAGMRESGALRPVRDNFAAGRASLTELPRGIATQVLPWLAEGAASAVGADPDTAARVGGWASDLGTAAVEPFEARARADEAALDWYRNAVPISGILPDISRLATVRTTPEGVSNAATQATSLGFADEIAAATGATDIETAQRQRDRAYEQDPAGSVLGTGLGVASMVATPGAAQIPSLARMSGLSGVAARGLASTIEGGWQSAAAGYGSSDAPMGSPERLRDGRVAGRTGLALSGAVNALSAVPQAVRVAAPALQRGAARLDLDAAPYRVRSVGVRTLPELRRVDQLGDSAGVGSRLAEEADVAVDPGGMPDFARRLDELGIAPRGSLTSPSEALERAAVSRQRSIAELEDVANRQTAIEATAQARNAERMRTGRGLDYRTGAMPEAEGIGRGDVVERVRDTAGDMRGLPSTRARVEEIDRYADDLRNIDVDPDGLADALEPGDVPWRRLWQERVQLDRGINYGPQAPNSRVPTAAQDRRAIRGALQDTLDERVASTESDAARQAYERSRRNYQTETMVENAARDFEMIRGVGNRQVSPSDYAALIAGGFTGDPTLAAGALLTNRLFRGREHAMQAAGRERLADLLRQAPRAEGPRAAFMRALAERTGMGVAAASTLPGAPEPTPNADPSMETVVMSDEEFNALPLLSEDEDLPTVQMTDEEFNALPLLEEETP